jgi:hypothetical protein
VVNRTAGCRTLAAGIDKSHNLYLILERFLIHDLFSDVTWFSNLSLSPWSKRTVLFLGQIGIHVGNLCYLFGFPP